MRGTIPISFILILCLHHAHSVCYDIWSFDCHERQTWGVLRGVASTYTSPNFPVDVDQDTTNLKVVESSIVSISMDLCHHTHLPHLEMIWIKNIGLESINSFTLENCKNLKVFKMNENNLEDRLGADIFQHNDKLEEIWLQNNKITKLYSGTFNHLENLIVLDLGGNDLEYFSSDLVVGLWKLRLLALYSNNLVQLDGVGLAKNLPALSYIYFNDNCLKCSDIRKIMHPFKGTSVLVSTHSDRRIRPFVVKYSEGSITCVGDDEIKRYTEVMNSSNFTMIDWQHEVSKNSSVNSAKKHEFKLMSVVVIASVLYSY